MLTRTLQRFIPVLLLAVLALPISAIKSAGQSPAANPQIRGAYFGQTPPGETPVLFAPDILTSLSAFAGAPTFSPDGTKCFVSVGAADYSTPATLYYSEWANNAWRPFVKAPFVLDFNSSCESVFSADGHTVTFTGKKTSAESTDFWTVDFTAQGWSTPVRMPAPINSGANEWRGSTMTDGTMYFGSERDRPGMYQVYKAYRDSGRQLVVEKLGSPINMNALEGDPCVAPDGHFLIFCSGRNGNSTDLFVSFNTGKGGWGTPINLGEAFNSGNDEYGAYLTHDGKYLFFTRHTPQGDGTYWVATSAVKGARRRWSGSPGWDSQAELGLEGRSACNRHSTLDLVEAHNPLTDCLLNNDWPARCTCRHRARSRHRDLCPADDRRRGACNPPGIVTAKPPDKGHTSASGRRERRRFPLRPRFCLP